MKVNTMISYLIVAVFCFVIGYQQAAMKHRELMGAVKQQKNLAMERLIELTAERDQKQRALDRAAKEQESKDRDAKNEIQRLAGELADRPVRVRIVTEPRQCGGGPASDTATTASAGAGSGTQASGLLPESNTKRLGAALTEIERLSAAYTSCRNTLFRVGKLP